MLSLDEKIISANADKMQRVQALVIGRLIVVFLLLVTSWVLHNGSFDFTLTDFPKGPFLIFICRASMRQMLPFVSPLLFTRPPSEGKGPLHGCHLL